MVANSEKPALLFESVEAWESWLAEHLDDPGVRLKMRKKRSTAPGITYDEALESALCFGWIDGQIYGLDDDYSLQVFTPRRPRSVWSQRNVGIIERLTDAGRMRPPGLDQVERAKADGRWDAAYSQKGMVVPADLQAALDASPSAASTFASLSSTARFGIVFRLDGVKRAETRERKLAGYLEQLERGESPI
ncbi:YdeI/OmpD-associated family protein [Microcella sp.]|uniref:YdeI/OmpD-associated family protein n=1 Tax=Microcella sp. TaxID=1913979 RepID=UPI0025D47AA1|nr:YdeI/OmpD-associated family protein [Microcella sp.]